MDGTAHDEVQMGGPAVGVPDRLDVAVYGLVHVLELLKFVEYHGQRSFLRLSHQGDKQVLHGLDPAVQVDPCIPGHILQVHTEDRFRDARYREEYGPGS